MKKIINFRLIGAIIMCLSYILFIGDAASMNDNVIDNLILDVAAFIYVASVSARWWTYDADVEKMSTIGYVTRFGLVLCFGMIYTMWAIDGAVMALSPVSQLLAVLTAFAVGIFSVCHIFIYVIYIAECHERGTKEKTLCK